MEVLMMPSTGLMESVFVLALVLLTSIAIAYTWWDWRTAKKRRQPQSDAVVPQQPQYVHSYQADIDHLRLIQDRYAQAGALLDLQPFDLAIQGRFALVKQWCAQDDHVAHLIPAWQLQERHQASARIWYYTRLSRDMRHDTEQFIVQFCEENPELAEEFHRRLRAFRSA